MLHLLLHFLVPILIVTIFYRDMWKKGLFQLLLALIIDVDHLLANPIYDPNRCSIGFHPLHTTLPIVIYLSLILHKKTRIIGIGLVIHIILDLTDCYI